MKVSGRKNPYYGAIIVRIENEKELSTITNSLLQFNSEESISILSKIDNKYKEYNNLFFTYIKKPIRDKFEKEGVVIDKYGKILSAEMITFEEFKIIAKTLGFERNIFKYDKVVFKKGKN